MISVHELSKQYAGRVAVDRISFEVTPGEIVGFLGPNGAGKSTTMRVLSGFMPPSSGDVKVNGFDVFHQSLQVRKSVGYMPEMAPLYTDMKVKEYLRFRAELKGLRGRDARRRVGEVMDLCSVVDVRRRLIGNLSKGYRQRVALADSLLHEPPLLILDEPTSGLDPVQIRQVRELLSSLRPKHTILLSTHILPEVEQICDRVLMIHQGRLLAHDTPANLTQKLRTLTQVFVEVDGTGEVAATLENISQVRKVIEDSKDGPWTRYILRVEPGHDIRETVMTLAAERGWKIRELHRQLPSLEDVFVELAASQPVKS